MSSSRLAYLNDLIQTAVPVCPLRSSDAPLLNVPRTRAEFARRSFSVAAPHTWNSLPSDVRSWRTVDTFKRHLKTHLFRQSQPDANSASVSTDLWCYTNAVIIIIIIIIIIGITPFLLTVYIISVHHCTVSTLLGSSLYMHLVDLEIAMRRCYRLHHN